MTYKNARIEALEKEVQRLNKENEALRKRLSTELQVSDSLSY